MEFVRDDAESLESVGPRVIHQDPAPDDVDPERCLRISGRCYLHAWLRANEVLID